jgi:thiamine pyrophosphokinase
MSKNQIQGQLFHSAEHFIIVGPMPFAWKDFNFSGPAAKTVVIFVDGGAKHQKNFKKQALPYLKNSVTLGDGDSSSALMDIKKEDQNLSDLEFCLSLIERISSKAKIKTVLFQGFLGLTSSMNRLDHLLFNISSILHFRQNPALSKRICVSMEEKVYFYPKGRWPLSLKGRFSFLSLLDNEVKIEGKCDFALPTKTKIKALSSRGLSNNAYGTVTISASKAFFIITE